MDCSEQCLVCGLRIEQLPPTARYVRADGSMLCSHPFGIPATQGAYLASPIGTDDPSRFSGLRHEHKGLKSWPQD